MSEHPHDDRLIFGAVITPEMWFHLDLASARTYGRAAAPEPGCISFQHRVKPLGDVKLEGPVKALSELTGALSVSSQRERTQRLGRFSRERDGYSIHINLFEHELDRFLMLMASGLRPRALRLEFDIEVPQGFDLGEYWDDVRYPYVDIHEYRIEWGLLPSGAPSEPAATSA